MDDRGGGGRGAAIGIAVIVVSVLVLLPFMIVVGFYAFAQVPAILNGLGFSAETINIPVFLTVLVGTVALFVLAMFGAVSLIGRSFSPKRRDRRGAREGEPATEISKP
jgi:uncharacterized membrane protein YjgN (DUF898 family)